MSPIVAEWRKRLVIPAILILVFLALTALVAVRGRPAKPPAGIRFVSDKTKRVPQVLAFMEADLVQGVAAVTSEMRGYVGVVSPHWLRFNDSGQFVVHHGSNAFVTAAQEAGMAVWPLVAYAGQYGTAAGCPAVLCDETVLARFVQAVNDWAATLDVNGLVLDVENLPPAASGGLVNLAARLAAALHAQRRQLWVAVFPQVDFPAELSGLHDVAALAAQTDGVVLMAYDQHSPRTAPGPIAAYDWVERNVADIVKRAPPSKVLLGLPAYGYLWRKQSGGWRASAVAVQSLERGERRAEVSAGGELWWESTEQAVRKANLVHRFGLRGVAVWRHGLANPELWPALVRALAGGNP